MLSRAFRAPGAEAPHDLVVAYTRLFLGPGQPLAPPYESIHREGRLMGECALHVAACYAEAGLQRSAFDDELPDHVCLELAFMAYLAEREWQDPGRAARWRQRQRRFLNEHLATWLLEFCRQIEESRLHPFYDEAARATKRMVEEEHARLPPAPARAAIPPFEWTQSPVRWRTTVPARGAERGRHPNLSLRVDPVLCTLCTLCAETCPRGALACELTPTTLALRFDPGSCNGCRACLRRCPEGALTLRVGPPLTERAASNPGLLLSAARVLCPECRRPHIAVSWLERLAERMGGGDSIRRSLARCPPCKAASGNAVPASPAPAQEAWSRA